MKKLLVILVMLLMQNVFAKPFPTFYRNSFTEITTETITREEVNFLRKYHLLNKENKNAMNTLLDLLYKQEKEKKLRKK